MLRLRNNGRFSWLAVALATMPVHMISDRARQLFCVTNVMLSLLAAGMAAQAAGFLIQADLLPAWGAQIWDSSAVLDQKSIIGRASHALVGYTDRPAGLQLVVYGATLAALLVAGRAASRPPAPHPVTTAPQRTREPHRV